LKTNSIGDPCGILVTIEGWGVNLAGCYGNALLPTPNVDRLAAHGTVFDQFWMHSIHLEPNLQAILQGLQPDGWLVASDSLQAIGMLRQHEGLDRIEVCPSLQQESFERLLTESLECWLEQRHKTPFLWIHSKGLHGTWDAPYEFRKLMCDSQDPDPPLDQVPPELVLSTDFDPDLLFGYACGAGAQSICIDQGLGLILQTLEEFGISENCWISMAGILGFPLGEHRRVGLGDRSMGLINGNYPIADAYSERLHTPWIIRPAQKMDLGIRISQLHQPRHLGRWVEQITQGSGRFDSDETIPQGHLAWATGVDEIAIWTERWSARFDTTGNPEGRISLSDERLGEVYCFPEDRWQQNEIANRVPEVQLLLRQIASLLLDAVPSVDLHSSEIEALLSDLQSFRR
jgi:hypothetical protein